MRNIYLIALAFLMFASCTKQNKTQSNMNLEFDLNDLVTSSTTHYNLNTRMGVYDTDGVFGSDTLVFQTGDHWKVLKFSDNNDFYIAIYNKVGSNEDQFALLGSRIYGQEIGAPNAVVNWNQDPADFTLSGDFSVPLMQTANGGKYSITNGVFNQVEDGNLFE